MNKLPTDNFQTVRQKYWNGQYADYWKKRVDESNQLNDNQSLLNKKDKLSSSNECYEEAISFLNIHADAKVLELGCGFGRSLPYLSNLAKQVFASDISEVMIKLAKEDNKTYENVDYSIFESENVPFSDSFFDYIICFGVFDAVQQTETLIELNRVLKPEGRILITGKNNNYYEDDDEAYFAEIGAAKKGHPNYFTDVKFMLKNIDRFGFSINKSRYFLRRGDFHELKFETIIPDKFYEYLFILEKCSSSSLTKDNKVSSPHSNIWFSRNL